MSTAPGAFPRHALGLPAGSVRALLAFGILGYLWVLALSPGNDPRISQAFIYLQMLMVLILAHFFAAHGKNIGGHISGQSPLGMPRGSVRFLLLGGYIGLAYFMFVNKRDFEVPQTAPVLLMLAILLTSFLIGHWLTHFVFYMSRGQLPAWFQDVQAWFALIGMLILGIIVIFRLVINISLPLESQVNLDGLEMALAGIVGFYFGARS
ncbi:MAG: hypothetical protein U0840_07740 [Gemmataceae bacterium]